MDGYDTLSNANRSIDRTVLVGYLFYWIGNCVDQILNEA